MKGSISYYKDRGQWIVSWYDEGRIWKITRYKGELMYHRKIAEKCLAMVQADYENYLAGLGAFRIEKYTGKGWTDVIEYFERVAQNQEKEKAGNLQRVQFVFHQLDQALFQAASGDAPRNPVGHPGQAARLRPIISKGQIQRHELLSRIHGLCLAVEADSRNAAVSQKKRLRSCGAHDQVATGRSPDENSIFRHSGDPPADIPVAQIPPQATRRSLRPSQGRLRSVQWRVPYPAVDFRPKAGGFDQNQCRAPDPLSLSVRASRPELIKEPGQFFFTNPRARRKTSGTPTSP